MKKINIALSIVKKKLEEEKIIAKREQQLAVENERRQKQLKRIEELRNCRKRPKEILKSLSLSMIVVIGIWIDMAKKFQFAQELIITN